MTIINTLELIITTIVPLAIFTALIRIFIEKIWKKSIWNENDKVVCKDVKKKRDFRLIIRFLISMSAIIISFYFFMELLFRKIYIIAILFILTYVLDQIDTTYQSLQLVDKFMKSNNEKPMTLKDQSAFISLSIVISSLPMMQVTDRIFQWSKEYSDMIVSDLLVMVIYVLFYFIYIFTICTVSTIILFDWIEIIKTIWNKLQKNKVDLNKSRKTFKIKGKGMTISLFEFLRYKHTAIKILLSFALILSFIFDVLVEIIQGFINLILEILFDFGVLINICADIIGKMISYILNLTRKTIITVSFRVALVVALIFIVVQNHYHPIFRLGDPSTAVLEFLASAIIIPVLFQWIYSLKNRISK